MRTGFERLAQCAHCGERLEEKTVPGLGRVYSDSRVHIGPEGMKTPYLLVLVDLEGAGRVLARLQGATGTGSMVDKTVRFDELSEMGPLFRLE
jgi:uncharacterized OB-fold protein